MDALKDIAHLLIQTLFTVYILAVLLRLLLQLSKADFYNPISQLLVKVTQPVLVPIRRVIPSIGSVDTASVVLVLLLQIIATSLLVFIKAATIINPLLMLIWAVIGSAGMVITIYFVAILGSIILSWIAPGSYNPTVILLHQLTEPIMAPFRKIIPSLGGLDLSPLFVFLALNVLEIILKHAAVSVQLIPSFVIGI